MTGRVTGLGRGGSLHYLRAAVPWGLLAIVAPVVAGLVVLVSRRPAVLWPLHGATLGLAAGAGAWAADERCAAVVDVGPRPLWWRTVVRAVGPVVLSAVWTVTHVVVRPDLPDHLGVLLLQGGAAVAAGFAGATWLRAHGRSEPGQWIASFVAPVAAAVALARPGDEHLPLFPIWPHEDWTRATGIWCAVAIGAVVTLAAAFRHDAVVGDPARRPARGRR